ncbi:EF-hand domain-containing protein [Streptomyces sp. NPDC087420]|uniref:EF-hand domain-containing protein n=1 Tax=Streptomyces sp. NPDC087420 TaxID=3365785 RepID=UPI0038369BE9
MPERSVLDIKLDRFFELLDTDNDGGIRESDVVSLATTLSTAVGAQDPATEARLHAALGAIWSTDLKAMDTDGNGAIDAGEYRLGVRRSLQTDPHGFLGRMGTLMQAWTTLCDTDGDGVISRDEYAAMYGNTFGVPRQSLDEAFTKLDRDGDGVLSREEINAAVLDYFTSDDPNAPGNWIFGPA